MASIMTASQTSALPPAIHQNRIAMRSASFPAGANADIGPLHAPSSSTIGLSAVGARRSERRDEQLGTCMNEGLPFGLWAPCRGGALCKLRAVSGTQLCQALREARRGAVVEALSV